MDGRAHYRKAEQFAEKGIGGRHHVHEVLCGDGGAGEAGDEQAVGDGLRDDIGEVVLREIVDELLYNEVLFVKYTD